MTRARDNSFNPFNTQIAGKNLVINGGMDIWQRGTSFASSTSTYVFTADRWEIVRHGYLLGMTVSRQTAGLDGFRYCARIQRDSGNTSTNDLQFQTSFETSEVLPFINKQMTISFYARKSPTASSSSLNSRIIAGTGTDQAMKNYTGGTVSFQQTFTLTDSWQRFSFSGTVSSPYNEFGIWFGYNPTGTAGAADYVEITGVQIELGANATQFTRNSGSIQAELAACQRYYQKIGTEGNLYQQFALCTAESSTTAWGPIYLPVKIRITPSGSFTSTQAWNFQGTTISNANMYYDPNQSTPSIAVIGSQSLAGMTAFSTRYIRANNDSTTSVNLSAEL